MNLIRNVTSIKRMLIFATVLSASATPAFAGQTWVSGNVQVRFLMESLLAAPSSSQAAVIPLAPPPIIAMRTDRNPWIRRLSAY